MLCETEYLQQHLSVSWSVKKHLSSTSTFYVLGTVLGADHIQHTHPHKRAHTGTTYNLKKLIVCGGNKTGSYDTGIQ